MKLDPRTKMIIAVCISSLAIIYDSCGSLFFLLAVTTALLLLFRVDWIAVRGGLKPLLFMIFSLFLIQCIFIRGGASLWKLGTVIILTKEGLSGGTEVALRIVILAAIALLFTTFNSRDFILGLVQLKFPYELAFMVLIAIRFLPLFREEALNAVIAVQLRGVELKKIPWGRKTDICRRLFFPLVYGALLRARQMSAAMETRAFRIYRERTYLKRLEFRIADYAVLLFSLSITFVLIAVRFNVVIQSAAGRIGGGL